MAVKKFTTEKDDDRVEIVEFELDSTLLKARKPKSASLLRMAQAADADSLTQVQALQEFIEESLTPESRDVLFGRLDDPDDDFDIADMAPIANWLVGEFTARPTGRRSASSASPKRTGSRSTARSRSGASTRKTSAASASATS
jgi:hypothetical protein